MVAVVIQPWTCLEDLIAADPVKGAFLSERALDGAGEPLFRPALWRCWDNALPTLAVMGLNPSTADARRDDMTVTKIKGFAQRRDYGAFILGNLYTYRATDPMALIAFGTESAKGFGCMDWIGAIVGGRDVLVAWGVVNIDAEHLRQVENLIMLRARRVLCLGVTAAGFPRHPSRIGYDTAWEDWTPERRAGR